MLFDQKGHETIWNVASLKQFFFLQSVRAAACV